MSSPKERHRPLEGSFYGEMRVLSEIERVPEISQRSLARRVGVSLALTNRLLHNLANKGYVRISRASWRGWLYTLTPAGFSRKVHLTVSYMRRFLGHYERIRQMVREELEPLGWHAESQVAMYGLVSDDAGRAFAELVYLALKDLGIDQVDIYAPDNAHNGKFLGMPVRDVGTLLAEEYDGVIFVGLQDSEVSLVELKNRGVTPEKLTVKGSDPVSLERIANRWAVAFVQKNSELFTSEAGRSYDFILAQYNEAQTALRKLSQERIQFLAENPLPVLKTELELKGNDLKQSQRVFLDLSADFTLKSQEYQEVTTGLNDLTTAGRWIGLQQSSSGNQGVVSSTPAQIDALQAKQQLFATQERMKQFQDAAGLSVLKQRLSLNRDLLGGYIGQLEKARNDAQTQRRTLEALLTEIKQQPQFLVLVKAVADPVLFQFLGPNPTKESWDRLRALGLQTEEVNPTYTALTERIIATRTNLETDLERISLLERRVEETRGEVKALEQQLSDKEGIQLPRLQNDLVLAQAAYDKEQASYNALKVQAVDLRNAVRKIQAQRDEYKKLVDTYQAEVRALSRSVASAENQIREFDRVSSTLESALAALSPRLQEARIAKEEQAGSIRVVEAAVEPRVPIGPDRSWTLFLWSPVLGLFLGVVLAFFVQYVQIPSARRPE